MAEKIATTSLQKLAAVAAVLMVAYTVFLGTLFPRSADLPAGYSTPIMAFEFAKTPADVAFLAGDTPAAIANRTAMDAGNTYDMVYPIFYGGLLALFLLQFAKAGEGTARKIAWVGFAFALLTIPTDMYENVVLLSVTKALASGQGAEVALSALPVATWAKWAAIALSQAALAYCFIRQRAWVGGVVCAASSASIWMIALSGTTPMAAELAAKATGIALLYLTLVAIRKMLVRT